MLRIQKRLGVDSAVYGSVLRRGFVSSDLRNGFSGGHQPGKHSITHKKLTWCLNNHAFPCNRCLKEDLYAVLNTRAIRFVQVKKLADELKFRRLTQAVDEMCPAKSESDFDVLFAKISKVESKQCESDRIIRALKEEIQHLRHIILGTSKKLEAGRHVQLALERINNTIECVPELDMRTRSFDLRLRELEDCSVDQHQNLRNELRAEHQQLAAKTEQAISKYQYHADRTLESMLMRLKRDNDDDREALESRVDEAITRQFQPVINIVMEQVGMCRKAISDVDQLRPRVDSVQRRLNVMAHSLAMGLPHELSAVVITDCRETGILQHLRSR